ncbi:MAG: hypothetical protein ACOYJE_06755 [Bacteroidaceae bacterium]|jgi:hypothetical protein
MKVVLFEKSRIFAAVPTLCHKSGAAVGTVIHRKAFPERFDLTIQESRKFFRIICQKQSNKNAPWDVSISLPAWLVRIFSGYEGREGCIINISVGLSRCSFRQIGQCESL